MSAPRAGETYRLPSGAIVVLHHQHVTDSFSCYYVDERRGLLTGKAFKTGVTLTFGFLTRWGKLVVR